MFKNDPSVNLLFLMAVILTSSCTERFYKVDDFPKLTKFDTHVHLSGSNTGIAIVILQGNAPFVAAIDGDLGAVAKPVNLPQLFGNIDKVAVG